MSKIREVGVDLAKEKNYSEAMYLLEKAAAKGDLGAVNDIGVIYERNGDYEKAMEFYKLAGLFGSGVAIHNAGNLYETGKGLDTNYTLAMILYRRSAKLNYPHAFHKIATFYQYGKSVEKNEKKAFEWALKGVKLELKTKEESACLITVGYYYEMGIGVKKNYNKALKYYTLAAKRGNVVGKFDAALIHLYKKNNKKHTKIGIDLLIESSKQNYPDAFAELAVLYQEGKKIEKDVEIADYWLTKGIKHNSWRALLVYSDMCLSGENIDGEKKPEAAIHALAIFLAESGEYREDYQNQYIDIKNAYKDEINWDDLEKNPELFIESNREKCFA